MKLKLLALLLFWSIIPTNAQIQEAPAWEVTSDNSSPGEGEEITLTFTAEVPRDWYMYSNDFDPDLGPMLTEIAFEPNNTYELIGSFTPVSPKEKFDDIWEGNIRYFTGTAVFQQKLKVLDPEGEISGLVTYQICTDVSGQCIPFETELSYPFSGASAAQMVTAPSEASEAE